MKLYTTRMFLVILFSTFTFTGCYHGKVTRSSVDNDYKKKLERVIVTSDFSYLQFYAPNTNIASIEYKNAFDESVKNLFTRRNVKTVFCNAYLGIDKTKEKYKDFNPTHILVVFIKSVKKETMYNRMNGLKFINYYALYDWILIDTHLKKNIWRAETETELCDGSFTTTFNRRVDCANSLVSEVIDDLIKKQLLM
jgi:hypothetical protein